MAVKKIRRKSEESGIALLLAIFVLLLISVVGIAMMAASGTEVSLTGNYRSSTAVYYAALSGLEEGRGRLLPRNPNYFTTAVLPSPLPLGHVIYITNPIPGDPPSTVDPTNLGSPATFPDTEYANEFPLQNPPSNVQKVSSVLNIQNPPNTPNPPYKWVRINALTENALQIDVNYSSGGTSFNKTQLVYFDGSNLTRSVTANQALGVTALAALPDGSQKLLQYVVGPVTLSMPVASALTLAGPGTVGNFITFNPPSSANSFHINGRDQQGSGALACGSTQPDKPAVGVYNTNDYTSVSNSLSTPPPRAANYTGAGGSTPNVADVHASLQPPSSSIDMTDPNSLGNFVVTVQSSADAVLTGPVTNTDLPSGMSSTNPMTVVVNGDLTLNGFTGYGLLLVTGKLTYTSDSGWRGIVLVIGQGTVIETGATDTGEFDGAVFIANTFGGGGIGGGGSGVLGPAHYTVSNPSGRGIYYDSCWIQASLKPYSYKILAFHEIPYP